MCVIAMVIKPTKITQIQARQSLPRKENKMLENKKVVSEEMDRSECATYNISHTQQREAAYNGARN